MAATTTTTSATTIPVAGRRKRILLQELFLQPPTLERGTESKGLVQWERIIKMLIERTEREVSRPKKTKVHTRYLRLAKRANEDGEPNGEWVRGGLRPFRESQKILLF